MKPKPPVKPPDFMITVDTAAAALLKACRTANAGILQIVIRNAADQPIACVIVSTDPKTSTSLVDLANSLEDLDDPEFTNSSSTAEYMRKIRGDG